MSTKSTKNKFASSLKKNSLGIFGYKNVKKPELPKSVWLSMIGLTTLNIIIASAR